MSNTFQLEEVEWDDKVNKKYQKQWRRKLRRAIQEEPSNRNGEQEIVFVDRLKSMEAYDYKKHPNASGKSLIGWAMSQGASVVFSVRDEILDSSVLGWAVQTNENDDNDESNSNNNDHHRHVELFVTQEQDILNIRVDEVPSFAKLVVKYPAIQDCVNKISIRRPVVAFLFAGFYANALLIAMIITATNTYLKNPGGNIDADVIMLYVLSGYFILREALQFSSEGMEYMADPWNILDVARVGLTITSATIMWKGELGPKDETILLTTAVFIFAGVISFLRSAFLPFSKFVTGVRKIVVALLPFLVISFVVLLGFGYMYWVQRFECPGKCNLIDGFYSAYAFFVGGPDEIKNLLDIFTGFVLVIILLNVVIAIVTTAWDENFDADEAFWRHRVSFLIELRIFLNLWCCRGKGGIRQPAGPDVIGADIDARVAKIHDSLCGALPLFTRIKLLFQYFCLKMFYIGLLVLGLVTFGFYWPCRIRKYVFGMNRTEVVPSAEEEICDLKQEIKKLQRLTVSQTDDALRDELNELKKGMEEIRLLVKSIPGVNTHKKRVRTSSSPKRSAARASDTVEATNTSESTNGSLATDSNGAGH